MRDSIVIVLLNVVNTIEYQRGNRTVHHVICQHNNIMKCIFVYFSASHRDFKKVIQQQNTSNFIKWRRSR
jgi:hypothetical protein